MTEQLSGSIEVIEGRGGLKIPGYDLDDIKSPDNLVDFFICLWDMNIPGGYYPGCYRTGFGVSKHPKQNERIIPPWKDKPVVFLEHIYTPIPEGQRYGSPCDTYTVTLPPEEFGKRPAPYIEVSWTSGSYTGFGTPDQNSVKFEGQEIVPEAFTNETEYQQALKGVFAKFIELAS